MNISMILLAALLMQGGRGGTAPGATPQTGSVATGSIEGIVIKQGSNEPVSGADVELTRFEGTAAAPVSPAARAAYDAILNGGSVGIQAPPPLLPEVQYFKTAADGKFLFQNLKPGSYRIATIRIGEALNPAEYLQRDSQGHGVAIPIAPGQAMKDIKLEMTPTVTIAGRVLDGDGEPMARVTVQALQMKYLDGPKKLFEMAQTVTNDRGEYRLFWMFPGQYYLSAHYEDPLRRTLLEHTGPPGVSVGGQRAAAPTVIQRTSSASNAAQETYALVYYGNTMDAAQAKSIELAPGGTFTGADFNLGIGRLQTHHLRGTVLNGATGQPAKGATVRAVPRQYHPIAHILTQTTDDAGVFDLSGAAAGDYILYAVTDSPVISALLNAYNQRSDAQKPALIQALMAAAQQGNRDAQAFLDALDGKAPRPTIGMLSVQVTGDDVNDIRLTTTSVTPSSGRITIEGRAQTENDADMARIRVGLVRNPDILGALPLPLVPPVSGPGVAIVKLADGQPAGNGAFTLQTAPGDFRVTVTGLPLNAYVKSIRMGAADVLTAGLHLSGGRENPIEIVVGTDSSEVRGSVANGQGQPLPNAVVALVPDGGGLRARPDLYKSATSAIDGKFRMSSVPPGNYKLFAWEYAETNAWQDSQFLQAYETLGKSISVGGGSPLETPIVVIPKRK